MPSTFWLVSHTRKQDLPLQLLRLPTFLPTVMGQTTWVLAPALLLLRAIQRMCWYPAWAGSITASWKNTCSPSPSELMVHRFLEITRNGAISLLAPLRGEFQMRTS